jgi:hypothetical protein
MPIPETFETLAKRMQAARDWSRTGLSGIGNRCAVVMSYTIKVAPDRERGDVSAAEIPGSRMTAVAAGQGGPGLSEKFIDQMFVRAAQLLPRVLEAYGPADVLGEARIVWSRVEKKRGVVYLEDCYPTAGDTRLNDAANTWLIGDRGYEAKTWIATGDHWDLFDGAMMIVQNQPLRNNKHPGKLYFWEAR